MDTTHQVLTTIDSYLTIASHLVIIIGGAIAVIFAIVNWSKGGLRFIKASKKISHFVSRVDCLIDDFVPEILSGLEKKGFISTGTVVRWTSMQAKVLKAESPVEITDEGRQIIGEIGFDKIYSENVSRFQKLMRDKLISTNELTEFDVEQASLKVIAELFDNSDLLIKSVETYSFNNPKMPLSELKALLGIFLRDKIIKNPDMRKNFGMPTSETKPPE